MNTAEATRNDALGWAKLISNVFHPWAVLVPVLALAAYQTVGNSLECIEWTLVAYLPALIFPFLYAKVRAMMLSRGGTRQQVSRSLFRNDPVQLLIMNGFFGIPSVLILHYLNGPDSLLVIILGSAVVMFVIALVNLKYRASFHLSMVTGMLMSLWFLFGAVSFIAFLLIPILGYSRYQLGEHTPTQLVTGLLIGLVISVAIFSGLGLGA